MEKSGIVEKQQKKNKVEGSRDKNLLVLRSVVKENFTTPVFSVKVTENFYGFTEKFGTEIILSVASIIFVDIFG